MTKNNQSIVSFLNNYSIKLSNQSQIELHFQNIKLLMWWILFSQNFTNPQSVLPSVPASIYKVSEDIIVNEGSNVTLSCLATGRPEPTITWRLLDPSGKSNQQSLRWKQSHSALNLKLHLFVQPDTFSNCVESVMYDMFCLIYVLILTFWGKVIKCSANTATSHHSRSNVKILIGDKTLKI